MKATAYNSFIFYVSTPLYESLQSVVKYLITPPPPPPYTFINNGAGSFRRVFLRSLPDGCAALHVVFGMDKDKRAGL
jgi:hypothetical protein